MNNPTDNPTPPTPGTDGRLTAAHAAVAMVMFIAIAVLGWLNLQVFLTGGLGGSFTPQAQTNAPATPTRDPLAGLGLPAFSSDTHRPLDHEPLNLTPINGAQQAYRFTTHQDAWINEVSLWRIPASAVPTVFDHYADQARSAGFDQLLPTQRGATHRTWYDHGKPPRTLTVLLIETQPRDEIHAVVWLRYAIDPADASGDDVRVPAPHAEAAQP